MKTSIFRQIFQNQSKQI